MLLKRMDETIQAGLYDPPQPSSKAKVYLVELYLNPEEIPPIEVMESLSPTERAKKLPKVHGKEIDHDDVPQTVLHYDDTNDTSNKSLKSYQKFYHDKAKFGAPQRKLYSGSSSIFSKNVATLGGTAKAAIYLRYSAGFIAFLKTIDEPVALKLEEEQQLFEQYFDKVKTSHLPKNWLVFDNKKASGDWPLAVICRCSNGKYIVPFLRAGAPEEDYEELEELGIDVEHSLALMEYFTAPGSTSDSDSGADSEKREVVDSRFQMGSGLGRNPFGRKSDSGDSVSEYLRLKGVIPETERAKILQLLNQPLSYPVKVAPVPNSALFFIPENWSYSDLAKFIFDENQHNKLYMESHKKNRKNAVAEDSEPIKLSAPKWIPTTGKSYKSTIFLVNNEPVGSNKVKKTVQRVFPSVEARYFRCLNHEFESSRLFTYLTQYSNIALSGTIKCNTVTQYQYWTEIFTKALQKQPISGYEVYQKLQQFLGKVDNLKEIEKKQIQWKAKSYFDIIGKLLRLQYLIAIANEAPEQLDYHKIEPDLYRIEHFDDEQIPKKGVFEMMTDFGNAPERIFGENFALLNKDQKEKVTAFMRRAVASVPQDDFDIFMRGALAGMLLSELERILKRERKFLVTQGRKATRLRGRELIGVFTHGLALLKNLKKEFCFNGKMCPFIKSVEEESYRDAFNNGLVLGMVFQTDNKDENESEEVENDRD